MQTLYSILSVIDIKFSVSGG